jgi:microcystin-dependent protein
MALFNDLTRCVVRRGLFALALLISGGSGFAQSTDTTGGGQPFSIIKPTQVLYYVICNQGVSLPPGDGTLSNVDRTSPFVGEIKAVAINSVPAGYLACDGTGFSPSVHPALFALLGTNFGGGPLYFTLPDLRHTVPIGAGEGFGAGIYFLGRHYGADTITLGIYNLPAHSHTLPGGGNTGSVGGNFLLRTLQSSLAINFLMDADGEIAMFAGTYAPQGWTFCNGSLLQISNYPALYNYIGTNYGGDGVTTFAVPDLRGRSPVGAGSTSPVSLGEQYGTVNLVLSEQMLPSHNHSFPGGNTGNTGSSLPFDMSQPVLGMTWATAQSGASPGAASPFMGEMRLFAGAPPSGAAWVQASGQLYSIHSFSALYTNLGTNFGGDGKKNFGLPNLDARMAASWGEIYVFGGVLGASSVTLSVTNLAPHAHPLPFAPTLADTQWLTNGGFQFSFTNIPNNSFTVLTATNLALPTSNWTAVATITNISPGQYQFTSTPTNEAERFYQIRMP